MLYYWLKPLMQLALTVFYRRRRLIGFENVPATGPVIFACNHPNSFLDAMIVGANIKRQTHFLARSDVFNSPLKLWILSQFKLIPIYRLQEGAENLGKNKDTFDRCHAIFRNGGAVLMFTEGLCIQEMRLRPLKKGTARIAMEYSKDGSPLTIIPTGLNYMKPMVFREDVVVSLDTPFNAADFAAEYNDNNGKGIQSFNKRLLEGLQNSVIDIRDKQNEKEIELLVEVEYNNGADLKKIVQMVKQVNEVQKNNAEAYNDFITLVADYRSTLKNKKITDEVVKGRSSSILWLLPAVLVFGLAFWLYMIPVGLAVWLVNKKVRLPEFKDSVLLGASVVFSFFYWVIVFSVATSTLGIIVGVQVTLVFLLIATLAGPSYDTLTGIRYGRISKSLPDKPSLMLQRDNVSGSVLNLIQSHQSHHPVG